MSNKQKENQEKEAQTETMTKEQENNQEEAQEHNEPVAAEEDTQEPAAAEEELSEVDQLKIEVQEAKDKYLRLYSEFENYRRRTSKEKVELISTANESLVVAMLPVVDDFERAINNINEETDVKSLEEGINLIHQKFIKVLNQKGVEKIDTGKGADFDDDIHEAITQIPAPEEDLKGKIVDVVEPGYKLGEKVIRFAKVVTGA